MVCVWEREFESEKKVKFVATLKRVSHHKSQDIFYDKKKVMASCSTKELLSNQGVVTSGAESNTLGTVPKIKKLTPFICLYLWVC